MFPSKQRPTSFREKSLHGNEVALRRRDWKRQQSPFIVLVLWKWHDCRDAIYRFNSKRRFQKVFRLHYKLKVRKASFSWRIQCGRPVGLTLQLNCLFKFLRGLIYTYFIPNLLRSFSFKRSEESRAGKCIVNNNYWTNRLFSSFLVETQISLWSKN